MFRLFLDAFHQYSTPSSMMHSKCTTSSPFFAVPIGFYVPAIERREHRVLNTRNTKENLNRHCLFMIVPMEDGPSWKANSVIELSIPDDLIKIVLDISVASILIEWPARPATHKCKIQPNIILHRHQVVFIPRSDSISLNSRAIVMGPPQWAAWLKNHSGVAYISLPLFSNLYLQASHMNLPVSKHIFVY
jgi:hypothetical protein